MTEAFKQQDVRVQRNTSGRSCLYSTNLLLVSIFMSQLPTFNRTYIQEWPLPEVHDVKDGGRREALALMQLPDCAACQE